MIPLDDNRAVTATFRVFGGIGRPLQGEVVRRLGGRGSHLAEARVLGVVVPALVAVVFAERLVAWLGPVWGWLWLGPVWFVGIQAVAIPLGLAATACARVCGDREGWRWRWWLVALCGWAWWAAGAGTWVRWVGFAWLGLAAFEVVAAVLLGWQWLMKVGGVAGVRVRVALAAAAHLPLPFLVGWCGWAWAAGWAALVAAAWARATFAPNATGFGPVAACCDGAGVWLTIDDGPDPATTPALLDLLDQHRARATFFVIGEKVAAHPDLALEILRRGHELGNHTHTHPVRSFWAAGPRRTRREISDGSRAIEAATGVRPRWFRAPVGHSNYFTHPAAAALGLRVIGWTRRGFDGVSRDVPRILARLLRQLDRGDILITHDATPVAAEVLAGVLAALADRGLRAVLPDGRDRHF